MSLSPPEVWKGYVTFRMWMSALQTIKVFTFMTTLVTELCRTGCQHPVLLSIPHPPCISFLPPPLQQLWWPYKITKQQTQTALYRTRLKNSLITYLLQTRQKVDGCGSVMRAVWKSSVQQIWPVGTEGVPTSELPSRVMHAPGESPSASCTHSQHIPCTGLCILLGAHIPWATGLLGLSPPETSSYRDKQIQGKADPAVLGGCCSMLSLKGRGTSSKAVRAKVCFYLESGGGETALRGM